MGTEAVWIPLVMGAVSAAGTAYNAHEVAKDTDNAAAQGIAAQAARQRQADDRVSQEVNALEQSTPEDARAKATEAFMAQLQRTRGEAVGPGTMGATSSRYAEDSQAAAGDVEDFGQKVAGTLARINAPGIQRQQEGQGFGRLASGLSQIGRAANGDQFINDLRMRSIRGNPWIDAGSQLAGGVATGMASNGGYGTGTGTTKVPKGGVKRYDAPARSNTRGFA